MDIAALSMAMSQNSLAVSASTSVLKLAMDSGEQLSTQMTDMMSNMAVDTTRGTVIDVRA